MKKAKVIARAKSKLGSFSARGSRCPLCGKDFRHGCNHSVKQAQDKLFEDYVRAIK